ncbi:hypothetical protein B0T18DRAFT_222454 [Schizothecium vesticola]|uniref:Uncharacterized protein n=1 Tax=Schizothecium vesticola TaxID=314040 RepID=A0AA40EKL7_9PEZI|nr:hypothetical protein B0T18DRAFT_222454 [Schizothecium vesticola]
MHLAVPTTDRLPLKPIEREREKETRVKNRVPAQPCLVVPPSLLQPTKPMYIYRKQAQEKNIQKSNPSNPYRDNTVLDNHDRQPRLNHLRSSSSRLIPLALSLALALDRLGSGSGSSGTASVTTAVGSSVTAAASVTTADGVSVTTAAPPPRTTVVLAFFPLPSLPSLPLPSLPSLPLPSLTAGGAAASAVTVTKTVDGTAAPAPPAPAAVTVSVSVMVTAKLTHSGFSAGGMAPPAPAPGLAGEAAPGPPLLPPTPAAGGLPPPPRAAVSLGKTVTNWVPVEVSVVVEVVSTSGTAGAWTTGGATGGRCWPPRVLVTTWRTVERKVETMVVTTTRSGRPPPPPPKVMVTAWVAVTVSTDFSVTVAVAVSTTVRVEWPSKPLLLASWMTLDEMAATSVTGQTVSVRTRVSVTSTV